MADLLLIGLSLGALVLLLLALACLSHLWLKEPPEEDERMPVIETDPSKLPVHARPVPIYLPRKKASESEPHVPAARAPIPLSKFQGRRPPPHLRLRSILPRAELPRSSEVPCEVCKGLVVVWTRDPGGGWRGLCRRCGLPFAEKVSGSGWQRPDHPAA